MSSESTVPKVKLHLCVVQAFVKRVKLRLCAVTKSINPKVKLCLLFRYIMPCPSIAAYEVMFQDFVILYGFMFGLYDQRMDGWKEEFGVGYPASNGFMFVYVCTHIFNFIFLLLLPPFSPSLHSSQHT